MQGMTVIVKTVTRWVKVFIVLYGIYITLTGHLSPGGGFAGGVIIACAYILLTLAYGKDYALAKLSTRFAEKLDCIGALLFLATAVAALLMSGIFFENILQKLFPGKAFMLFSSGIIPINNIAICLKVGAPLFAIFIILSVIRIATGPDGTRTMVQDQEEE